MKVHITPVTTVQPYSAGGAITMNSIEAWYDPSIRVWTATFNNDRGFQIGDCVHGTSRQEVEDVIKSLFSIN